MTLVIQIFTDGVSDSDLQQLLQWQYTRIEWMRLSMPVSYTHLDVYKRQPIFCVLK